MKRALFFSSLFFACGPSIEPTRPFIHVVLTEPTGFTAPAANRLEFTTTSTVDGDVLTRAFEVDIDGNDLPTDFVVRFTEGVRGEVVDIVVEGFLDDVNVYSAKGSAIADTSDLTIPVSFCGDDEIDDTRQEACDDGLDNANNTPNVCRANCSLPTCGDGVFDSDTEQCDDGNLVDADGCEADCSLPACGNGIFELEDFNDPTQGGLASGCFVPNGQTITFPDIPYDIIVTDFDQDGFLDIVNGFISANFIAITIGNGDGTFQPSLFIPTPSSSFAIDVADFSNTDDFPDFVVGEATNSQSQTARLSVVINTDGVISNSNSFLLGDLVSFCSGLCTIDDVFAGNVDGDAIDEIVFSITTGEVLLQENDSASFGAGSVIPGAQRISVKLKDVDLDGNQDLVTGNILSNGVNQISVARGNGNKTFQAPQVLNLGAITFSSGLNNNIAFADVNSDGLDDMLTCILFEEKINITIMNLSASLINNQEKVLSENCFLLQVKDLDKDSREDVFFLKNVQDQSLIFGSSGFGVLLSQESFQIEHNFTSSGAITDPTTINAGDFNGDGVNDLVVGGTGALNGIEVLLFDE